MKDIEKNEEIVDKYIDKLEKGEIGTIPLFDVDLGHIKITPIKKSIYNKNHFNKKIEKPMEHPLSYDWHDGHSDHHTDINKAEDNKPEPFVHSQAHGPDKTPKFAENTQVGGVSDKSFNDIVGNWGTTDPKKPSTLKFYKNIENHASGIQDLMDKHGYKHYYAGGKHGKPNLANKNYNTKDLMVYDPTPQSGGDFDHEAYTDAWRKSHELAHALTHNDVNDIYGEGRRLGKLGVRSPREMKRAAHWEWLAAHKQRDLMSDVGYKMNDDDFHRELNTVMGDATHRAITGKFTEPSTMGFQPHSHKIPLHESLNMIDKHAKNMGLQHDDDTHAAQKKESIEKGELKNAVRNIAVGAALASGAHEMAKPEPQVKPAAAQERSVASAQVKPKSQSIVKPKAEISRAPASINYSSKMKGLDDQITKKHTLSSISDVESSGGKNVNHQPLPKNGLHQGESAFGSYGLTPLLIRETIKKHPDLMSKYSHLSNYKGQLFHEGMSAANKDGGLEREIASRHYDRLAKQFGHSPAKIGYAWLNGVTGTHRAIKKGKDINSHWHVKKIMNAYNKKTKQ